MNWLAEAYHESSFRKTAATAYGRQGFRYLYIHNLQTAAPHTAVAVSVRGAARDARATRHARGEARSGGFLALKTEQRRALINVSMHNAERDAEEI